MSVCDLYVIPLTYQYSFKQHCVVYRKKQEAKRLDEMM